MKCTHFYVSNRKGHGVCQRCGNERQFPGYGYQKLKPGALRSAKRGEFCVNPDLCARSYVRVT